MAKTKTKGVLWDKLNRGTARLYTLIAGSFAGRILTGYRKADHAFAKSRRYTGRHRCTPMSPARLGLLSAVEGSLLFKSAHALFRTLFCLPLGIYGLFFLIYGAMGAGLYFALPRIYPALAPDLEHLLLSAVVVLLSIPLLLTQKPLAEALGAGGISYRILVRFLGIPRDRLEPPRRKMPAITPYLAVLLALLSAGGALFTHPLLAPVVCLAVGVLGLIFTYPEAGVVFSTLLLPAVWLNGNLILLLCTVICLTWLGYGVKLLFLHRTLRFGLLDTVILIFGGLILLSGCTGVGVTRESVLTGIILFICLSDYFLIVNLMTTRAYIRRCLLGVGISVAVVTLLAYIRVIPLEELNWLEGSRGGDAIIAVVGKGIEQLSGLWLEHSELYLVLVFPWLYAYLSHTKRLLRRLSAVIFIALDMILIMTTDSVSALFCVLLVTVLFILLYDHKGLSVGLTLLPLIACGTLWVTYLFPVSEEIKTILSRSRHFKGLLADSLWQMVRDYPAGIGIGEDPFLAVYPAYAAPDLGALTDSGSLYFELLLSFGWGGMILFGAVLFLFIQKCMTGLSHTFVSKDRAMLIGGVTSITGALILGTVRSFITSPRVFLTLILVIALCSAYVNILFDENDVLQAGQKNSPEGVDRLTGNR